MATNRMGILVLLGSLMVPAFLPAHPQETEEQKRKRATEQKKKPPTPATKPAPAPAPTPAVTTPPHQQHQQQTPAPTPAPATVPSHPSTQATPTAQPGRVEGTHPNAPSPAGTNPNATNPNATATPAGNGMRNPGVQPTPGMQPNNGRGMQPNPTNTTPTTGAMPNRGTGRMPATPPPTRSFTDPNRNGRQWEVNNRGQIATIRDQQSGMTVHRGIGEHRIVTERPDHSRIVSVGARVGFVERPLARQGYVSRTYVVNGNSYARVYRSQAYRGVTVYRYVPAYYYQPVYYGWAWNPWVSPVRYRWGWYNDPWYGYYGGYFAPSPYYGSASLWLVDYLMAENLRLAYQNQMAQQQQQSQYPSGGGYYAGSNSSSNGGSPALSPELKQALAEEVRQQIAQQQAEAAAAQNPGQAPPPEYADNVPPPALDPNQRIFVVSSTLNVVTPDGGTCALTAADMILRTDTTIQDNDKVGVSVLSSKPGECPVNTSTLLQVSALQEMHNQFCAQVSDGLKTLGDNQGRDGIPAGPAAMQRASANGQAQADATAAAQLQQQQRDAQQMEAEARRGTPNNP